MVRCEALPRTSVVTLLLLIKTSSPAPVSVVPGQQSTRSEPAQLAGPSRRRTPADDPHISIETHGGPP
ncbi:hypothetical protein BKA82DRAFT_1004968 [Pisolithus tinctorius]|uniref:Secreted protein n=1 Tax=Pisolithus tinctorius Marx 270 TaxID=870435 RepID=A0A0C3NUK9_PISTI|nr:hypothetical protein BKA82DRAFT_1004968 [Pisolithus tinctorius]KIN99120.1 hypothetical protein M404DRAFT_1004968 [Pisolithus tinctorius Marx 270]